MVGVAAAIGCFVTAAEAPPTAPGPAVSGLVLTLEEAIRVALAASPELRASGARVAAATGRAQQARRWPNPELEFGVEDWPVNDGGRFRDAKQTLGIVQTLPYPGKKSLDRQAGGAGVKVSEAELAVRRTEVVRDVKAGFYRVLAAERLVAVSTQLVAVAESFATAARKRVEAGAAAYQEQLRAEVQEDRARTELTAYERELATARRTFATLLGRLDLEAAALSGSLEAGAGSAVVEAVEAEADMVLGRHPSAAAARANLEQAQLGFRRARLEPYPDVKMGVAGGRVGSSDESIVELGFSVPLPIFDRGRGRQQEAAAGVEAAEAELQGVQQRLHRELDNARRRLRAATDQVGRYRERILPKADEALRLVQAGFDEGKFGFIDLVDTQRTTAEARLAYQEKLLEMQIARAELEAVLRPETHETKNHP